MPSPSFGKTGMSHQRFDIIFQCCWFGEQPERHPQTMPSSTYRWLLIDNFVDNFNKYWASNFTPLERICVNESMSRWYGLGGNWINMGLPQYVAIDHKPENSCEIQNVACARSGVIIWLKLVKGKVEDELAQAATEDEKGY